MQSLWSPKCPAATQGLCLRASQRTSPGTWSPGPSVAHTHLPAWHRTPRGFVRGENVSVNLSNMASKQSVFCGHVWGCSHRQTGQCCGPSSSGGQKRENRGRLDGSPGASLGLEDSAVQLRAPLCIPGNVLRPLHSSAGHHLLVANSFRVRVRPAQWGRSRHLWFPQSSALGGPVPCRVFAFPLSPACRPSFCRR